MPQVKKFTATQSVAGIFACLKATINVSSSGIFYAHIDDIYKDAVRGVLKAPVYEDESRGTIKIECSTLDGIESTLRRILDVYAKPEITHTHVIHYNIESHVSFAIDGSGNVFPNAGFPGAEWSRNDERFGEHHATNPSRNGYSLTIGARALTKTVTRYGTAEKVEYSDYYKGESHLGYENPAQLLNSWCSFSLPRDPKEIPYSDEAALFFHELMLAMATLSKRIQDRVFDQNELLKIISSGQKLLGN